MNSVSYTLPVYWMRPVTMNGAGAFAIVRIGLKGARFTAAGKEKKQCFAKREITA